ncbi:hypothetical protein VTN77DRAFT_1412 [Rasamsonia byssochlamydoides]|uniref:uncharacterized protein n=1 Tax=Rasamsonia byssochlamydoides TaxID=89139 RepID=UPI0037421B9B
MASTRRPSMIASLRRDVPLYGAEGSLADHTIVDTQRPTKICGLRLCDCRGTCLDYGLIHPTLALPPFFLTALCDDTPCILPGCGVDSRGSHTHSLLSLCRPLDSTLSFVYYILPSFLLRGLLPLSQSLFSCPSFRPGSSCTCTCTSKFVHMNKPDLISQ